MSENKIGKKINLDRALHKQVLQKLIDNEKNPARDFSVIVEDALKLWLRRDAIANHLQAIFRVAGEFATNPRAPDEIKAHISLLLQTVLDSGSFKLEPAGKPSIPLNAPVNLRDGIDRPAKDEKPQEDS